MTDLPIVEIHAPFTVDKAGEFAHVSDSTPSVKTWPDGHAALVFEGVQNTPDGSHPMKLVVYLPRDPAERAAFLASLADAAATLG